MTLPVRFASPLLLALACCGVYAQQPAKPPMDTPQALPLLPFQPVANFLQLPPQFTQGEVAAVQVDTRGHLFVLQRAAPFLSEWDANGRFVRALPVDDLLTTPHGLRFGPDGNLWVTDTGSHIVLKLDLKGRVLMVLGHKNQAAEGDWLFNRPADVAFAANGDILIADGYGNSRIVRFDKDGRYLKEWGSFGKGSGEFDLPHSIVVDKRGRIYVADRENARIQVFDDGGKFLEEWRNVGYPFGLFLTPDEKLWVADGGFNRLLELDLNGKVLGTIGTPGRALGQMAWPHFLAVDSTGRVFVADVLNWRVDVFQPTGKPSPGMSPYVPTRRLFDEAKPSVGYINQPKK